MITKFILMIKSIFKELDKKAIIILKHGLQFCAILCLISITLLIAYQSFYLNPLFFHIGLLLFKTSTIFSIEFIICAIAVDKIKNQIV